MLLKLIPWFFLLLICIYVFYLTYKLFNRIPPKEGSKEYFDDLHNDADKFI